MQIGFILFPNVTQLDFTGPLQVLHRMPGATTHILATTNGSRAQRLRPQPHAHRHICGCSLSWT